MLLGVASVVANDFNVVAVRVEEEAGKVALVIMSTGTGGAVVTRTRVESCLIARANGHEVWCGKGHVKRTDSIGDMLETEKGVVLSPEPGRMVAKVSNEGVSERSKYGEVEACTTPDIADGEVDVVDHSSRRVADERPAHSPASS